LKALPSDNIHAKTPIQCNIDITLHKSVLFSNLTNPLLMLLTVLLQGATGAATGQMIILGLMLLVFFIFIMLPQQRKQKKQREFIDAIKRGDEVVTTSGIHGKVVGLEGHTVLLEIDRGIKIRIEKAHISQEFTEAVAKSGGVKTAE
jgi:preprotein translocase subunit YajC